MNDDPAHVSFFCVIPKNLTIYPKDLALAQKCCKEHGFKVDWIKEEDCMKLKPCTENVFILAEFGGPLFEFLKSCNSKVIGPQCMLALISNGELLNDVSMSIFNFAMKGIVVTSTGLSSQEKKVIQEKIQFMGGIYLPDLSANITHLLVKSVANFSSKFKVAVGKRIPRMIPQWIDVIWDANLEENIHGTDPIFTSYSSPIFQGCVMSASQIPVKQREAIKKIIEANGGQYSAKLEKNKTNILITASTEGEKYIHARRWKILCLKPEWIQASLDKGYAVDPKCFSLKQATVLPSAGYTPETHDRYLISFGNGSVNSTIFDENQQICQPIDETVGFACSLPRPQRFGPLQREPLLECLDLTLSVKAGPFLKGNKVFLSGFSGPEMEKLRRILSNVGVARSFVINKSVSHIIVGKWVKADWDQLRRLENKPHIVTVEWLAQSLRMKSAAPETDYLHPDSKDLCNFNDTQSKDSTSNENNNESLDTMQRTLQSLITEQIKEKQTVNWHLVFSKTDGIHYEKTISHGVPAVNPERVIACTMSSSRPKEDLPPTAGEASAKPQNPLVLGHYVVTSENAVKPTRPSADLSMLNTSSQLPKIHFDHSSSDILLEPPATPVTSYFPSTNCGTPSHLHFSTTGINTLLITPEPRPAVCNMLTPNTPYGRLLNPDPSPGTRKMWKHALDNQVRLTPRVNNFADVTSSPNEYHPTEIFPGITGYFENLAKRMLCDCLWSEGTANRTGAPNSAVPRLPPLHEVVIFFGDIESSASELVNIVECLGGRVCYYHCKEVTHYVSQHELTSSRTMLNVQKWQQKLVSAQWILDCERTAVRLEESHYLPPSSNSELSSYINCEWLLSGPDILETNSESHNHFILADGEEERHQTCLTDDLNLSPLTDCLDIIPPTSYNHETNHDAVRVPQCLSQSASKIAIAVVDSSKNQKIVASRSLASGYCVMFSGMSQADRDSCTEIIENLGATVVRANQYDPACTHLVVAKLGCNEKLLTAIAAGKWIVHPGWVYESEKMRNFVDERKYEWGNPTCNDSISKEEAKIATAAYYWRTNRNQGLPSGPFHGITAALHLREGNDSFRRLLEAGGGDIVPPGSALENRKTNLCIIDNREIKKIQLSFYASQGIYCVPLVYLRDVLFSVGNKLQWSECVLPEFLHYLPSMPDNSS